MSGRTPGAWKPAFPWCKSQLTWSASGAVNGGPIPVGSQTQTALNTWAAAAPSLVFPPLASGGDIVFGAQDFGPSGPGGVTLGQTAPDGSTVTVNNDAAVAFVPKAPGAPSLLATEIHEIGHALGLLHNTSPASVMYPFYTGLEALGPEDIAAIRALYSWAPQTPIPDIGTDASPALCACGTKLVLAWRGIGDDLNIHYAVSSDGLTWTPQQTVPGAASADGPSLAFNGVQLVMVWRGVPGDQGLYFASWDLTNPWSVVTPIGNTGSSFGPSISVIGSPIMAWKGVDGDSGVYFSTFTNGQWGGQRNIGGIGSSDRPAIAADPVTNVPRLVWKGIEGDHALWTSTLRGLFWQPQEQVAWVIAGNGPAGTVGVGHPGSQYGPGLTSGGGRLSMVWRGIDDDQTLWYTQAAPDPAVAGQALAAWSTQANVGGFATSSRPTIAAFSGNTHLAWKGAGSDHRIFTTSI